MGSLKINFRETENSQKPLETQFLERFFNSCLNNAIACMLQQGHGAAFLATI